MKPFFITNSICSIRWHDAAMLSCPSPPPRGGRGYPTIRANGIGDRFDSGCLPLSKSGSTDDFFSCSEVMCSVSSAGRGAGDAGVGLT